MARILIIDDEEHVRNYLQAVFLEKGYEVKLAADGRIGEQYYRENPGGVVIIDIYMPEQDGLETIMNLQKDFPTVKIIALSGGPHHRPGRKYADVDTMLEAAEKMGASLALKKPVDLGKLEHAVESLHC